jgi:sugar-specific transcriptional regulator TrmB
LKRGAIEKTLKNFGLSKKEAEIYIFLGKRGPLKAREITKHLKMNKGQVYRILKNLQKKGLVEATLEFPTRFTALPFKDIIDAFIKSKREEVVQIEETKKDLLSDWKNISQTELDSSLEKFSVIEGNKKIFYKISQMIKEANTQFAIALTVSDLLKAEQFGLFDFSYDKINIEFRVLTQLSKQNLKAMKFLKPKLKSKIAFRVTNPSLGASRFSRMAIRDNDGVILFISDKNKQTLNDAKEVCLSTNCKSIIEAFLGAFEDFWKDSTDIDDRICEIEKGTLTPKTYIINDAKEAHKKYHEIINSTNKEIIISTSAKGLVACYKGMDYIRTWIKKGVSVKIMAPIVS